MASFDTAGKVITCKAAVAYKANKAMVIEEIQVDPPKTGEVRVKITHNGLCHSDLYVLVGKMTSLPFPVILGHEAAGIVESVGDGVSEFAPGDHVIPSIVPQCRACKYCANPNTNHCEASGCGSGVELGDPNGLMRDGTSRITCRGEKLRCMLGIGSFAQYTVIQAFQLAKVSHDAPLATICLLGCGITTGYGAVCETCKVPPGSRVAVWGLGAVGLAAVMGAKASRATQIVAIDPNPAKFEAAHQFGATECINPADCPQDTKFEEWLVERFDGGFDFTIECSGHISSLRAAVATAHRGWGVACVVGLCLVTDKLDVSPFYFITGRTLKGSLIGGYKSKDALPGLVKDYQTGKIQLDNFITHRFPLEEVNTAVELLKAGNSLRSVIALHSEE